VKSCFIALLFLFSTAPICHADGFASPPRPNMGTPMPPPRVGIDQKVGAKVPLELPFKDEHWKLVSLSECVARKPTILVLAYYRCPMLCNEVLNGLLTALRATPDDVGAKFNVVVVSFDPREKPPLASLKKAMYLEKYDRPGTERGWHFLTGDSLAIEHLTEAVGFGYKFDANTQQYAHGSGIVVLAPDGTISRYLLGVSYDPGELQKALDGASRSEVGALAEPVLLLCFRYDATTGKYTPSVLKIVRLASGIMIVSIVGIVVSQVRRNRVADTDLVPETQED
jgi:protein SCO1/2